MKIIRTLFFFFGSITFAIFLITLTAGAVIAGTILESFTDSHQFAAQFIYGNSLFHFLLWGFFINIFLSSLRRWPFQWKHLPFLITHLGLLMILAGALVKSYRGIQGGMGILEGSASQRVFLSNTYALQIETKDPIHPFRTLQYQIPLTNTFETLQINAEDNLADFKIKILENFPHSIETQETWIKGEKGEIAGREPFPLHTEPFPLSIEKQTWYTSALRGENPSEIAKEIYLNHLTLKIKNRVSGEILYEGPYKPQITWGSGSALCELKMNFSEIYGLQSPEFSVLIKMLPNELQQHITIPLSGKDCHHPKQVANRYLGQHAVTVDLVQKPFITFIQDLYDDIYLFAFDPWGQIEEQTFTKENIHTLVAYDQGFGGYALQTKLPFPSLGRENIEHIQAHQLKLLLHKSLASNPNTPLSPPLECLKQACGDNFVNVCVEFLQKWDQTQEWLFPLSLPLSESLTPIHQIKWESIPDHDLKACYWTSQLIPELEKEIGLGKDILDILDERKWPLIQSLKELKEHSLPCTHDETENVLTYLSKQLYEAAESLPSPEKKSYSSPQLLSAYLRMYGIHLKTIVPSFDQLRENEENLIAYAESSQIPLPWGSKGAVVLETPLKYSYRQAKPSQKLENNIPMLTIEVSGKHKKETVTLGYDRFGIALPTAVLDGEYLLRFVPRMIVLPYRLRLRDARQISYANSTQPFSYECDLWIKDMQTGESIEKTLSMNHIYETWGGHRFYLANINPSTEEAPQRVQLIVSHDPGKYYLTYPGAIILLLGIVLLFWIRPYSRK